MENITVSGNLPCGYRDPKGDLHRAYTLRSLTIGDLERMAEEHPDLMGTGNFVTSRRVTWAFSLEKLGDLSREDITPDLLAQLSAQDYVELSKADEALEKKLLAAFGKEEGGAVS